MRRVSDRASEAQQAVVVMGKLPRPGRVKTRLTPAFSPEVASQLYAAFLADVFALVDRARSGCEFDRVFACEQSLLAPTQKRVCMAEGDVEAIVVWPRLDFTL